MTDAATTTPSIEATKGASPLLYTRSEQEAGHATLWAGKGLEKSPTFSGLIDDARVSLFKVEGKNGIFFNVAVGGAEGEKMKTIGVANVRVNPVGIPKLVIDLKENDKVVKTIWADFRKEVTDEMLVSYGLDLAKRAAKKAEYEAKKAAEAAAPAPAAAVPA